MSIKINIMYQFREGPWGGGNQFLKAVKAYFEKTGVYVDDYREADVLLFNSFPTGNLEYFKQIKELKKRKNIAVIHRVDGPIYLVRGRDLEIDRVIFSFNQSVADGTIFQTEWSRRKSYELGMAKNDFEAIIHNAPNSNIFYPAENKTAHEKLKIIATSWSPNMAKGFDIYSYLDKTLNFNKYEMTFVGNSPMKFENITYIEPQTSDKLAELLRSSDIFITGSVNDTCSNSLIEAMRCGLPALVRNSGGHPELIGKGGLAFNGTDDILKKIEEMSKNYDEIRSSINAETMDEIGASYYDFCKEVFEKKSGGTKKFSSWAYFKIMRGIKKFKP